MTKKEIDAFIEIMKTINEDWTPERVEATYGDCTLKEALDKRISGLDAFYAFAQETIDMMGKTKQ